MLVSFEVGGHYRNRHGPYEVVNIDGNRMVIRYEDGTMLSTTVKLQWRIWKNLGYEAQAEKLEEEKRKRKRQSRGSKPRIRDASFDGFQDSDFQLGTAGTTWRSRQALGGVLARRLMQRTSYDFLSWAVPRWPWVHVARPEHYRRKDAPADADAKFEVQLNESEARFGLYIERGDSSVLEDPTKWDCFRFFAALSQNRAVQQTLRKSTAEYGVVLQLLGPETLEPRQVSWGEGGLVWIQSGERTSVTWPDVAQRLETIDPELWINISMGKKMPKDDAIARGANIADDIIAVFLSLLPVYEAATGLK